MSWEDILIKSQVEFDKMKEQLAQGGDYKHSNANISIKDELEAILFEHKKRIYRVTNPKEEIIVTRSFLHDIWKMMVAYKLR